MAAKKHILTGLNAAFVNTKRPAPNNVVQVVEGEELPTDLADGELDRLEALGAFGEHPRFARERAIARASAESNGFPIPVPDEGFVGENVDVANERELREAAEARAAAAEQELADLKAAAAGGGSASS